LFSLTPEAVKLIQQLRVKHKLIKVTASCSEKLKDLTETLRNKEYTSHIKLGESFSESGLYSQSAHIDSGSGLSERQLGLYCATASENVLFENQISATPSSSVAMKQPSPTKFVGNDKLGFLDFFINVSLMCASLMIGFMLIKKIGPHLMGVPLSVSLVKAPVLTILQIFYLLIGLALFVWGFILLSYVLQNYSGLIILITIMLVAPKEFEKLLDSGTKSFFNLLLLAFLMPIILGSSLLGLILCSIAALFAMNNSKRGK
jgi:hypothetical protein